MGIILWIIFGGLAGWIASIITGDNDRQGIVGNVLIGVLGAFIGGAVAALIGLQGVTGFNLSSFIIAVLGATALLMIVKPARNAS